ncbi:hypothetical protein E1301_Tti012833 [Triplophysa tibetana]|uniref:Uncharacterized protein n=1 Tax=Triplophysa tibetana TaxID=1572043 RepID=A0A5A9NRK2_9TELE|nr:hypothetical protein E1301_Tti012833 [Triplophysa tibetana]
MEPVTSSVELQFPDEYCISPTESFSVWESRGASQLLSDLECSGRGRSVTPGFLRLNSEPSGTRPPLTGGQKRSNSHAYYHNSADKCGQPLDNGFKEKRGGEGGI